MMRFNVLRSRTAAGAESAAARLRRALRSGRWIAERQAPEVCVELALAILADAAADMRRELDAIESELTHD